MPIHEKNTSCQTTYVAGEQLVSAIKQRLLEPRSQNCVESDEVANSEFSLFAYEGEDIEVSLACQPIASITKSSKPTNNGSKATAQQKRILDAARAAQMETIQCQMAQWCAAQMTQWPHVAFIDQAHHQAGVSGQWKEDNTIKVEGRLKEGDIFEVEEALVTCDKAQMIVEPPARGTVVRVRNGHTSCSNWFLSVKFEGMVNCKRISSKDYHKLKKVVHSQAALDKVRRTSCQTQQLLPKSASRIKGSSNTAM